MKTRQEIKLQAKTNMGRQRATAVLIELTVIVIALVCGLLGLIPFIGWIITVCGSLIAMLLQVSISGAYTSIYKGEQTSVGTVISNAGVNPARKIGGLLWEALFLLLWSLLFFIPGIVKAYSYMMTPFILAVYPDVPATAALKLSMRMTQGHKWKLFVMQLSFIGWMILSALTLYILLIFHVGPYMQTTLAGYFVELRDEALRKGIIRPEELGMEKSWTVGALEGN
ncbi:MAG: DUF975 family protein [Firmicutes bacterium]|nr:DUF975 family protein [Bacillota bacterium]